MRVLCAQIIHVGTTAKSECADLAACAEMFGFGPSTRAYEGHHVELFVDEYLSHPIGVATEHIRITVIFTVVLDR